MLPQLPEYAVREALDRRDVKLNGKRVDRQAMLIPGAEVRLYTPGEEIREPEIPILYEDSRVLVIRKPAGISCQKDAKGGQTITELVARQLRRQEPNAREPLLCHRLDNQTDGLLLLCRDEEAQAAMEEAFRQRRIRKRYLCLTKGTPQPDHAVLRAFLTKDSEKALVRITRKEQPGSLPIVTEYTVLEPGPCARVEILSAHGPHPSDPRPDGGHRSSPSGGRQVRRPGVQQAQESPAADALRRGASLRAGRGMGLSE